MDSPRGRARSTRIALAAFNLILLALLLHWARGHLDPGRVREAFSRLPWGGIPAAVSFNLLALVLGGVRMGLLLRRPLGVGFAVNTIGDGMNTAAPLRLGEVAKVYYGHLFYGIPVARLLAATVATEMAELVALLLLSGLLLVSTTRQSLVTAESVWPLLGLLLAGVSGLLLARFRLRALVRVVPRRFGIRRKAIELWRTLRRFPAGKTLAVTALIWIADWAVVRILFGSALPGAGFGAMDSVAVLLILNLVNVLPSAPAGLGIFEAGIALFLVERAGIGLETAVTVAFVFHLVNSLPQLLIAGGIIAVRRLGSPRRGGRKARGTG